MGRDDWKDLNVISGVRRPQSMDLRWAKDLPLIEERQTTISERLWMPLEGAERMLSCYMLLAGGFLTCLSLQKRKCGLLKSSNLVPTLISVSGSGGCHGAESLLLLYGPRKKPENW